MRSVAEPGRMIQGRLRRDIHDRSVPLLQHRRNGRAHQRISGAQVQRQHLLKDLRLQLPKLDPASIAAHSVDQRVQPANAAHEHRNENFDGSFIRNVHGAWPSRRAASFGLACALQGRELLLLAVSDDGLRARLHERKADSLS